MTQNGPMPQVRRVLTEVQYRYSARVSGDRPPVNRDRAWGDILADEG